MSIALDLALFIRDFECEFPLSLSNLGVAYTLAFRIGSNPFTWISQENLAKELRLHETNVRIHCKKLVETGILLIKKDTDDKRKNLYSFNSALINYHQKSEDERKKYRAKLLGIIGDTERNHPVNTERNHPVINCSSGSQDIDNKEEKMTQISPKAKEQSNILLKQKEISVDNLELPSAVPREIWEEFVQHRKDIKRPMTALAIKKMINKLNKIIADGHDPIELIEKAIISGWQDIFVSEKKPIHKSEQFKQNQEIRSTVEWFNNNH